MQERRYESFNCVDCAIRCVVRSDRAMHLDRATFRCERCTRKQIATQKFIDSLGEFSELIQDTCVEGKHRFVLVPCAKCNTPYWTRFDSWEEGHQKCYTCEHPNRKQIHGKWKTPLHARWLGVVTRTEWSKREGEKRIYQDRGIKLCDEWRTDFAAFERWAMENGFRPDLILDRIDNSKGYSPDNCRWVTVEASNANRRKAIYIDEPIEERNE
jgi:hypothetical protein